MWKFWLIVSGICLAIEAVTVGFLVFWFAVGALLALITSFITDSIIIQSAVFLISSTLLMFLAVMLLAYPKKIRFNKRTRIGTLFIVLMIYVGTCFIQLLTWASVGKLNLGLSTRYFVPLFAMFPIIGTFRIGWLEKNKDNLDKYAMVFIIAFMAVMVLSFATKYY